MKKNDALVQARVTFLAVFGFFLFSHVAFSQKADSAKTNNRFGGAVTVTNNGISLLPTFSLGKPAVMFDMLAGSKKLSFEPQFRFSLDGKPWSFIFWWRYKLLTNDKFRINVGAHPAIAFKTVPVLANGDPTETIMAHRYFAGEFSPNYFIKKNISVGIYYLHSHGFDEGSKKSTHFLTVNSNFSNINLSEQFLYEVFPAGDYLRIDGSDGYYVTGTATFAKRNFPLSFQSMLNQTLKTDIPARSNTVWNVSLIYSFSKDYPGKQGA